MDDEEGWSAVERWERRAEVPLLLLALAFLVAYAWPILDPRLDPDLRGFLTVVSWTVWAAFAADFLVRLCLAERRLEFALRRWYDVAPIALPMLRPLRLLRLVALIRILNRSAWSSLASRTAVYVTGAAGAAIGLGALAVLQAERADPDANIRAFGDAVWWAACTVTTVGYGDFYPVTTTGRVVAVVLMFLEIGVVGAVTAVVATSPSTVVRMRALAADRRSQLVPGRGSAASNRSPQIRRTFAVRLVSDQRRIHPGGNPRL